MEQIRHARRGYRSVYGARKTWKQLKRDGVCDVGRERVARVMRTQGWEGVRRGRRFRTTIADAAADRARDLVQRNFTATRPDQLWVCDLTYIRTIHGFVCLAFILDVYSRLIVGWQLASHMRTELVTDALEMAHALRAPTPGSLVAHTDRGSQGGFNRYTSISYTDRLDQHGIAPSVGSRGDAYDNAMAEAFVATYKSERVQGRIYPSFEHAEYAALTWIGFYNHDRLHEELNDVPPIEYETLTVTKPVSPVATRRQVTITGSGRESDRGQDEPLATTTDQAVSWPERDPLERIEGTT